MSIHDGVLPSTLCDAIVTALRTYLLAPTGLVKTIDRLDDDDPETAIRREAIEETGHQVGEVTHVFDAFMSPGSVTERLHFYAAPYDSSTRRHDGGGLADEGEHITVLELDIDDVKWLEANTQHLDLVCPEIQLGGWQGTNNVIHGKQSGAFDVSGAIARYQEVKPMNITSGRFLNQADLDAERKVCVIGSRVQDILFEFGENPLGETVQIQGVLFRVVGVYTPKGNDEDAQNEAESIYIPFTTFGKAFNTRADRGKPAFSFAVRAFFRHWFCFTALMAHKAFQKPTLHHSGIALITSNLMTTGPTYRCWCVPPAVYEQQRLLIEFQPC